MVPDDAKTASAARYSCSSVITRACAACASKRAASSSVRMLVDRTPPRASIASDALSYSLAIVLGMSTPLRISKTDATIESTSGLAVTRSPVSTSSSMRWTKGISASTPADPSRCVSASRCWSSESGASCSRRKPEKRTASTPAGREVHSTMCPCCVSTSTICRSISVRLTPPSSRPSIKSRALRAIIAWRSMRYSTGCWACTSFR
mmetsp:Transcript_32754/g.74010  ORF Transcript_32754/g.74010 Transcript_32754/m.74010 type:complete len:206 (-) Transcript_32754:385-1002(-)